MFQHSLGELGKDMKACPLWFFVCLFQMYDPEIITVSECFQTAVRGESGSPGLESLQYRTSTSNLSFPSLTKSLSSLNVKSVNALLKILYLCTKPAYMKGWHSLKRKASQLSELIEYSKKAFCRQLFNFVNGLALAMLASSLYFSLA